MYILAVILGIIAFSLVGDISWDAILISVSIIVSACIISSTIKEHLEKTNDDDNKRN